MLEITVIYAIPSALADNVRVPITFNFFKYGENAPTTCCDPQTIYVVSKNTKHVEFTIADKELNELMGVASNGGGMASNILTSYEYNSIQMKNKTM